MLCYSKRTLPAPEHEQSWHRSKFAARQSRTCELELGTSSEDGNAVIMGLQASVPVDHGVPAERISQRRLLS